MYTLERATVVPATREAVFEFFSDPRNLERITPDGMGFKITHMDKLPIQSNFRVEYIIRPILGVPVKWVTRIPVFDPPSRFVDVQESGPYKSWRHEHVFEDIGGRTLMRDRVRYRLPFGVLGVAVHRLVVARQLEQIFDHRSRIISKMFAGERPLAGAGA